MITSLVTGTAAAAGTLRFEELTRLQAYLILLGLASALTAFGILPLAVFNRHNNTKRWSWQGDDKNKHWLLADIGQPVRTGSLR